MYRNEIDATGQPMSPDPFHAIENAIEHYRIDDILISTLKGEQSKWLEEGLIEKVQALTDKPVEHIESGTEPAASSKAPEPVGAGGRLMESASVASATPRASPHPPEANQSSRIDRQTLGILLFIVSEVMLFGRSSPVLLPEGGRRRAVAAGSLRNHVAVAGMNTAILISSSFTMHWALESIRKNNRRGLKMGLAMTFCWASPSSSSRSSTSTSASAPATTPSVQSSMASPASTARTSPSGCPAWDRECRAWRGTTAPEAKDASRR
jgi:hypothetical protein